MLKIYQPTDIYNLIIKDVVVFGSTAKVFDLKDGQVYKEYYPYLPLLTRTSNGLFLERILNLSTIEAKSFIKIKGINLNELILLGLILEKAQGELLGYLDIPMEELLPYDEQIRRDIIDVSSYFAMHDVNDGSIFFSRNNGFQLVDLDNYSEEDMNSSYNNLIMFYGRIIKARGYYLNLQNEMFQQMAKGIDYCRLDAINDVLDKFLRKYHLEEADVRVRKKM